MFQFMRAVPIAALIVAAGCVPIDGCPTCGRAQVAHVSAIYGSGAAFVGTAIAHVNEPIFEGDHFFTRAGAKMEVTVESGGTIVLGENTDPNLYLKTRCFLIRLFSGQMTVKTKNNECAEVESGPNAAGQHSYVLYQANPASRRLTITVFEGQVTTIRPPGVTINAGQTMVLQNGQVASPPRQLPGAVLQRMQQSWIQEPSFR